VIRAWSVGCSTGEEAYSLAILLQEHAEALKQSHVVQIFATDIDSQAITTARAGVYPASIAVDVSPERLARFFTAEADGSMYRVRKSIRDLLVFSEQDVIKDPPFSKLDLLSCRNLLIYMGGELQKKLIPLFHYALNPDGALFLGTSETIGEYGDLFAVLDRKSKLYQRKTDLHAAQRVALGRFLPPMTAMEPTLPPSVLPVAGSGKLPLRELTEQALLQQAAQAGALVNGEGDILYLHGRTGAYLEPAPGEAEINNIVKMAREGLRRELVTALHKAAGAQGIVVRPRLRVRTNGHFTTVNLTVCPVAASPGATPQAPLYLVILEEAPAVDPGQALQVAGLPISERADGPDPDVDTRITTLKQELRAKEEYLQTANEELATVNAELQTKVADLSRTNNDMNNLLSGTGIGTVFVDHQLRILRFTPAVTGIINLIPSDVGRPVSHIVSNLVSYDSFVADVQAVLDTLVAKEVDVQTTAGQWYTLRVVPYRTIDNVIEGAVITFVDITELKHQTAALQNANEQLRLAMVVRDAHDAITVQDLEGRTLAWNPGAVRLYGWSEAEALLMNARDRIPEGLREEALAKMNQLSQAELLEPYRTQRITKEGAVVEVSMISTALVNEVGQVYAIATTERPR